MIKINQSEREKFVSYCKIQYGSCVILYPKDVDILYKMLKPNTFVVLLDLGYNNIGDEGAIILGQLLQVN